MRVACRCAAAELSGRRRRGGAGPWASGLGCGGSVFVLSVGFGGRLVACLLEGGKGGEEGECLRIWPFLGRSVERGCV